MENLNYEVNLTKPLPHVKINVLVLTDSCFYGPASGDLPGVEQLLPHWAQSIRFADLAIHAGRILYDGNGWAERIKSGCLHGFEDRSLATSGIGNTEPRNVSVVFLIPEMLNDAGRHWLAEGKCFKTVAHFICEHLKPMVVNSDLVLFGGQIVKDRTGYNAADILGSI